MISLNISKKEFFTYTLGSEISPDLKKSYHEAKHHFDLCYQQVQYAKAVVAKIEGELAAVSILKFVTPNTLLASLNSQKLWLKYRERLFVGTHLHFKSIVKEVAFEILQKEFKKMDLRDPKLIERISLPKISLNF